ncbi:MAG TPA: SDR family NAD(P)-dependent oxidoreductase [Terriglobales bacterium]|nr:SDR family NAD(P)-dependent oxidoreductase [Terriglobales bacterium]
MNDLRVISGCAIVTGGGSGLGRAIAKSLAEGGAPIAVVDLLPDGATQTVEQITKAGGRAAFVPADVSRWDDVDRAVSEAVRQLGPLGTIVNAAGVLDGYAAVEDITPALFERVIAINLTGTFFGCKRALQEMVPRGAGRIINMASVAGLIGGGGGTAYVASKHGVVGITRQLATTAGAKHGITVNAICPGPIETGLRANSKAILAADAPTVMGGVGANLDLIRALVPLGRRGTVEEVAAVARFLASEGASYVTGATLVVDGGWTAQ